MGGGKINHNKSWNTKSLRVAEAVWKAERDAEEERKKIAAVQKQLQEEQQIQELRNLRAQVTGGSVKEERLDWMYNPMVQSGPSSEEYLLGKKITDLPSDDKSAAKPIWERTSSTGVGVGSYLDNAAKMREDPMVAIKRAEINTLKTTLDKLSIMKKLQEQLDAAKKEKKKRKEEKKQLKKKEEEKEKKKKKRKHEAADEEGDNNDKSSDDKKRKHKRSRSRSRSRSPSPPPSRRDEETKRSTTSADADTTAHHRREDGSRDGNDTRRNHDSIRDDDDRDRRDRRDRDRRSDDDRDRRSRVDDNRRSDRDRDNGRDSRRDYYHHHHHRHHHRDDDRDRRDRREDNGYRNRDADRDSDRDRRDYRREDNNNRANGSNSSSSSSNNNNNKGGMLSDEEKRRRLEEMMADAQRTQEEREQRLKKHVEDEANAKNKDGSHNKEARFINEMNKDIYLNQKQNVEDRLRSHVHYIQKTGYDTLISGNSFRR